MKKRLQRFAVAGLLLLGSIGTAQAALITGTTNIFGLANPVGSLPNATGVSFAFGMADGGSGDLAALDGASTAAGDLVMHNFLFTDVQQPGGTTIWTTSRLGGLTFNLTESVIEQTATSLKMDGRGFISSTSKAYDDTPITLVLTLNKLDGQLFGSMSSGVTAVPIPGAALLFGSALLGLAGAARAKAARRNQHSSDA
ncbi:hypothetical protein CKO25_11690 [Thiocapsa imhoffii]|uniref:VPLPA-CTERM sorting domain-containing protein n=2 Tax=Thiocapsa imhoffii TaxID=382777 RepID=A0A9X1B8V3_9GAMM|nr:hypothetical protein [Thiocapsa imhoffii]